MAIGNMEYERLDEQVENASRAGLLHTSFGTFKMPSFSASLRRRFEAEAFLRDVNAGMEPQVVSPHVSCRNQMIDKLDPLLGNSLVKYTRPLILPDPEIEALNFNCVARNNYMKLDENIHPRVKSREEVVETLFGTGLSSNQNWTDVHSSWRRIDREYGFSPLVDWMGRHLQASMSDVMLVPTPIVRGSINTVEQAFDTAEDMMPMATKQTIFTLFGSHFLIHSELFGESSPAHQARIRFVERIRLWVHKDNMNNTFISIKIYDPYKYLSNPSTGGIYRRNLSYFIEEIQEAAATFGSVVVFHDTGNRFLGFLDSGSDIVTSKAYGDPGVDRVIIPKVRNQAQKPPPSFPIRRGMVDVDYETVRRWFEQTGAFPVPDFMSPVDYGNFPNRTDQKVYVSMARIGDFQEIAEWYRAAQLDQEKTLRESMRSIYAEAQNKQDLSDMCPSLR